MGANGRTITPSDPSIIPLDAPEARRVDLGSKAANLAAARGAGLPVVDGFVVAAGLAQHVAQSPRPGDDASERVDAVRLAWAALSRNGSDPVVVRSSSASEDTNVSSSAGVFESVTDVRGWDAFLDAVAVVVASAKQGDGERLAVLVQRHIDPVWGGVMFGVDPVTGDPGRLVLAVVAGGPQRLVAGAENGQRLVLDRHGHVLEGARRGQMLPRPHRRHLADLARRVERLYGGPQDVEWAITHEGQVLLLQSRPITAVGSIARGPVLGPGPVAETFPDPLHILEQDLWMPPLREALQTVLPLLGRASSKEVERSPVLVVVDGRPAINLELLEPPCRRHGLRLLDPRPPLRRVRVAWQVGRLRAGLPVLIDGVLGDLDRDLAAVPQLDRLSDDELVGLLWRTRAALRAAHGYEVLAGALAPSDSDAATGAEAALWALASARAAAPETAIGDAHIVSVAPEVLALSPPAIGRTARLPTNVPFSGRPSRPLGRREALRLRIRWLHELGALAAHTLGQHLEAAGRLSSAAEVADVALTDLAAAVRHGTVPAVHAAPPASAPLPARFQLGDDASVISAPSTTTASDGVGAGGGRATGTATHDDDPAPGSILVVATLDPRLAPVLERLSGLVAETGSPLSHLAILAREHGVATAVGVPDARRRFPAGAQLLVDGTTGAVEVLDEPPLPHAAEFGP
ncbi:MAG: PEP/pyruvate-binding domain-containing protein [Microthrixaceae bacterium]